MTKFVRRSRLVLAYWEGDTLRLYNYATESSYRPRSLAWRILVRTGRWTSTDALIEVLADWEPATVRATIGDLLDRSLLESSSRPRSPREERLLKWRRWNPPAGFFHLATKDVPYIDPEDSGDGRPFYTTRSEPSQLKSYPEARRVELPALDRTGELSEVLLARRTWRRFGERSLSLEEVSGLLGLTWGIQRWMHLETGATVPLKTSPSGGARHSIEAYLLATKVEGIRPGTYHYCPETHALADLDRPVSREGLARFLPAQPGFLDAAAVCFMTSVFERVQWRYDFARAYRVVLLEAGHLCQTFCLVATSLGLAPFCTAALGDTAIERHLRVDGIGESVLYAAGAGSRPEGVAWAPWYATTAVPRTTLPHHALRGGRAGEWSEEHRVAPDR